MLLVGDQNQTYRQEITGGYLWSPKRNANGARNPFYEFMREVTLGDLKKVRFMPLRLATTQLDRRARFGPSGHVFRQIC